MIRHGWAKWIKKAPVKVDDRTAAKLGSVLEVDTGKIRIKWRKGTAPLLWMPQVKTLAWFQGVPKPKKIRASAYGPTARAFEAFSGRKVRYARTIEMRETKAAKWISFGAAVKIDYATNKKGRKAQYTHDLGRGVTLARYGGDKPPWLWILRGGKLNVTSRGILG